MKYSTYNAFSYNKLIGKRGCYFIQEIAATETCTRRILSFDVMTCLHSYDSKIIHYS